MRILSLVLISLFGWLVYLLCFGKNNVNDYWQIKDEIVHQQTENAHLKFRNEKQFAEIHSLKEGNSAIEERARAELGMIKSGEYFYRVISDVNNE